MNQTGKQDGTAGDTAALETLARRLVELWIDQAGALAVDPAGLEAAKRWTQAAAGPMAGFWNSSAEAFRHAATDPDAARLVAEFFARNFALGTAVRNPATGGSAPAGAAPDAGGASHAELARRVDELERRLAALESAGARSGGDGAGKPKSNPKRKRAAARSEPRPER